METKQKDLETPGINKEVFTLTLDEKWSNIYRTEAEIMRDRLVLWMKNNPGVMTQLKWCKEHPGETPILTEEMVDEFIETLRFKENEK